MTYRIRRKRGVFITGVWEFEELLAARARCLTLSSVIYPQAVDNYGSLGVCEPRPAAEDQRAPGRLDRTTVLGPWRCLFVGVWEFVSREKRLPCVRLGRRPGYKLVHPALQTSCAKHFVGVKLVPFRYHSCYVLTLSILTLQNLYLCEKPRNLGILV